MENSAKQALELIVNGDWEAAHTLVQDNNDQLSCLIHAYLHRDEGDLGNAGYWYRRAGEDFPKNSLPEELERLQNLAK